MMGRLRNALPAHAYEGAGPDDLLRRLDRLVTEEDTMATAQNFLLDPEDGSLAHSNAGHPPALWLAATGGTAWIEGALSPPLGTGWGERERADTMLARGDRVLLYTDG